MTEPIPIVLVTQQLTQGGTERQLTEMAKALDRKRFSPRVAVLRGGGIRHDELVRAGVPVDVFSFPSFASVGWGMQSWYFGRYLRRHAIQLVHSFDVPGNIFAVPAARLFRVPVVLSSQRAYRDLTPDHIKRLLRWTDRLTHGVVVNCQALERHLRGDEGLDPALIHLCYNGIDTEVFRPDGPSQRPFREDELVVGAVCALRPEKGLTTLVRAFAQVRARHRQLRLVIVGDGPVRAELEGLIEELSLGKDCVLAPSTSEVPAWLRGIDVFVQPSLSEALSNSVMEAMACRCAVMASAVGGNPELIVPGERGLLFPAGDADELARQLMEMVENKDQRLRMAEAGRGFIHERFSLATAARRMGEIYERMLARES